VILFVVGTPNCFEMENVKVCISLVGFDKLDGDLVVIVSERAKGTVLTLLFLCKIR
jgi:hypothetical protein